MYICDRTTRLKAERAIAKALALDLSLRRVRCARPASDVDRSGLVGGRSGVPARDRARTRTMAWPTTSWVSSSCGWRNATKPFPRPQSAVLQNPGFAHLQSGLAEVYLYCRRYDDAIRELEKTLALVRDSRASTSSSATPISISGSTRRRSRCTRRRDSPCQPGLTSHWADPRRPERMSPGRRPSGPGAARQCSSRGISHGATTSLGDREQALTWLERMYDVNEWLRRVPQGPSPVRFPAWGAALSETAARGSDLTN